MSSSTSGTVQDPAHVTSPKVTVATLLSLLAAVALALLGAFTNSGGNIFGEMNPILVGVLLIVIPPVATFLGGYTTKDPLRTGYAAPHTGNDQYGRGV